MLQSSQQINHATETKLTFPRKLTVSVRPLDCQTFYTVQHLPENFQKSKNETLLHLQR